VVCVCGGVTVSTFSSGGGTGINKIRYYGMHQGPACFDNVLLCGVRGVCGRGGEGGNQRGEKGVMTRGGGEGGYDKGGGRRGL
jgi:hypothetical protein